MNTLSRSSQLAGIGALLASMQGSPAGDLLAGICGEGTEKQNLGFTPKGLQPWAPTSREDVMSYRVADLPKDDAEAFDALGWEPAGYSQVPLIVAEGPFGFREAQADMVANGAKIGFAVSINEENPGASYIAVYAPKGEAENNAEVAGRLIDGAFGEGRS